MKKCLYAILAVMIGTCMFLSGCKEQAVEEERTDEILTSVSLGELRPGNFYVKSGDAYYWLPLEDGNFELVKHCKSNSWKKNRKNITQLIWFNIIYANRQMQKNVVKSEIVYSYFDFLQL